MFPNEQYNKPGEFFFDANIQCSHVFAEFLQSSLLLPFGLLQLADGVFECLLVSDCSFQMQAELVVLLAHSGSFSLCLIELRSQSSYLRVKGELCL